MATLYAWAKPAFTQNFPWDHTWVTDYDNRLTPYPNISSVIAAERLYWYCWGDFHTTGGAPSYPDGFIAGAIGDLHMAVCICQPNLVSKGNKSAQGTIFKYGIHGVCHQLANQVLFATKSKIKVVSARGYPVTSAIYGDYGTNVSEWDLRKFSCLSKTARIDSHPKPARWLAMQYKDSFDIKSFEVLHKAPNGDAKMSNLRKLRRQHQQKLAELAESGEISANRINALNDAFLAEAAEFLGPVDFQMIFEIPPGVRTNFVQQEILDASQ